MSRFAPSSLRARRAALLLLTAACATALACAGAEPGTPIDEEEGGSPILPVTPGEGEGEGEGNVFEGEGEGEGQGEGQGGEGEGEGEGEGGGGGEGEGEGEGQTPVDPPVGVELNPGFIGGACTSTASCTSTRYSSAQRCETSGLPGGFCTQTCTTSGSGVSICPDAASTGPGTGFTTTRCIEAAGQPLCAAECDFEQSPTGCRPGYSCVLRGRHNQPDRIFPVCLPEPIQRWPGDPAPVFDIGAGCSDAQQCAHNACMGLPGGYCTKTMCDTAGCPAGSQCFRSSTSDATFCLKTCTSNSQCRTGAGYVCDADNTCWPEDRPSGTRWDPSVGLADCQAGWGTNGSGLHRCDATKDNYIVVRKSARNLALCNRGALVANYNMGLGFAPTGDKEREGDGKTPEGVFYIPRVIPNSQYYKAFLLSYPDEADAARGRAAGLITATQEQAILTAQQNCTEPPQTTGLGGLIEIHGMGGGRDWTLGCIAVENNEMDVLFNVIRQRDTIIVHP